MKFIRMLVLLCLLPVMALAEDLILKPEEAKGFADNTISVTAPAEGELCLQVCDQYNVYRTMTFHVEKGENTLHWDGLAENQERISAKAYSLRGVLTAENTTYTAETGITLGRCNQALTLALPSSDTLYMADDDWFVEICLVRDGNYVVEVYAANNFVNTPVSTQKRSGTGPDPFKFRWKPKDLAAGDYVLRLYAQGNPDYAVDIPVTLVEGSAPVLELAETETFMPSLTDSDETIWNIMMQPSAVIDLRVATGHQEVYARPDKTSTVLGTLHGLSQAVQVIDIRDDGWVRVMAWNHEDGSQVDGYVPKERLTMVEPNSEYGLLLDKNTQTLTIFHQGKRLTTLDVSTGLMAKDKLFRETPAGSYLTLEHMDGFSSEGYHYEYPIRYDGGNLLHQLGLKKHAGRNDFSEQTPQLGAKASHGCIRLPNQVNEDGVNAYWLWTHLPYHTRLIILDDPEQRVLNEAMAEAGITQMAEQKTVEPLPELAEGETEIVITLGGDAVVGTRETWWKKAEALPAYLSAKGMAYPFSGLYDIFSSDDMTFVNLECVLKANSAGEDKEKQWRFRGLPEYTDVLKLGSIEQVNIANNHYIDYGASGKTATRAALDEAGMPYSGYGFTYVWKYKGHRIGFAGCRETTYKKDTSVIQQDIAALKEAGCEVIIYSCHWGKEYSGAHNELQETMAQAAVTAGADIVVGNHPHVVQGVDTIDNALVLYSLGNLMFGGTIDMTTFDATLAQVRLRFDENGYQGCGLELIPILTSGSAPANDYRPVVAEGESKERILTKIQVDSGVALQESMWFPAQ